MLGLVRTIPPASGGAAALPYWFRQVSAMVPMATVGQLKRLTILPRPVTGDWCPFHPSPVTLDKKHDWSRVQSRLDVLELAAICDAVGVTLTEFARRFESNRSRPMRTKPPVPA
jgi:hypothetical protein